MPKCRVFFPPYTGTFPFRVCSVGYHRNAPGQSHARPPCPFFFCGLILQGRGVATVQGKTRHVVKRGDVYIMHKGVDYELHFDLKPRLIALYFSIDGAMVESLINAYALRDAYCVSGLNCRGRFDDILEMAGSGDPELHPKAALITHEILSRMARKLKTVHSPSYSPTVHRLKLFIDNHVDSMIPVKTLCGLVSLSPTHVIRIFKAEIGITPHAYQLNRKIDVARHLLSSRHARVNEVARTLGFSDVCYFSRLFKQKTGISPLAYRRGQ